jgi:hypothetical protein
MKFHRGKPERMVRDPMNAPHLVLWRIQQKLMPEHALDIVAINMINGEYVLGKTMREAEDAFEAKWPGYPSYVCRLDGGGAARI